LHELYNPSSPSFRQFLTVEQFTERFGPSQQDFDALIRFAKTNGLTVTGGSRDSMDVQLKGSVATIETAFHV
jgi:kumamolisin